MPFLKPTRREILKLAALAPAMAMPAAVRAELGKPAGQDDLHGRPNAVASYGIAGAVTRFDDILAGAISSIPACKGEASLAQMVRAYADRLVPAGARDRRFVPGE